MGRQRGRLVVAAGRLRWSQPRTALASAKPTPGPAAPHHALVVHRRAWVAIRACSGHWPGSFNASARHAHGSRGRLQHAIRITHLVWPRGRWRRRFGPPRRKSRRWRCRARVPRRWREHPPHRHRSACHARHPRRQDGQGDAGGRPGVHCCLQLWRPGDGCRRVPPRSRGGGPGEEGPDHHRARRPCQCDGHTHRCRRHGRHCQDGHDQRHQNCGAALMREARARVRLITF
mmetsp:Transcript_14914/g.40170  ORF Transcript_14914/g.40170 Transcript_14914/m.40170 type:complete len:231 (+) Transcript_14914:207-899(+)